MYNITMSIKDEFLEIYNKHIKREGAEKLLAWLESSDFFTCPASTRFHSNFEGGLVTHSINVYNRLVELVKNEYGESYQNVVSDESLAIMGLLHDVCKVNTYKTEYKNTKVYFENGKKIDELGKFDWQPKPVFVVADDLPYGHGEKSVYMLCGFIKLTREEAMAINWHMSGFDMRVKGGSFAISDAYYQFPVAVLLAMADMMASYLDEKIVK